MLWVGDEPERPRRAGVAAAGDEHAAGAREGRRARRPVDVGEQRMRRMALAVGGERRGSAAGRRAARRRGPPRSRPRGGRGRGCGTAPAGRGRTSRRRSCRSTIVPPSRSGEASRQSRIAWPRPVAAAVIGFSGSRGSCSDFHGSGTTIVSRLPARGIPRSEIAAQQRLGVRDRRRPGEHRDRPSARGRAPAASPRAAVPGSTLRARRSGEWATAAMARGDGRIAAVAAGQARMVEHDRDARHRRAARERGLDPPGEDAGGGEGRREQRRGRADGRDRPRPRRRRAARRRRRARRSRRR